MTDLKITGRPTASAMAALEPLGGRVKVNGEWVDYDDLGADDLD